VLVNLRVVPFNKSVYLLNYFLVVKLHLPHARLGLINLIFIEVTFQQSMVKVEAGEFVQLRRRPLPELFYHIL